MSPTDKVHLDLEWSKGGGTPLFAAFCYYRMAWLYCSMACSLGKLVSQWLSSQLTANLFLLPTQFVLDLGWNKGGGTPLRNLDRMPPTLIGTVTGTMTTQRPVHRLCRVYRHLCRHMFIGTSDGARVTNHLFLSVFVNFFTLSSNLSAAAFFAGSKPVKRVTEGSKPVRFWVVFSGLQQTFSVTCKPVDQMQGMKIFCNKDGKDGKKGWRDAEVDWAVGQVWAPEEPVEEEDGGCQILLRNKKDAGRKRAFVQFFRYNCQLSYGTYHQLPKLRYFSGPTTTPTSNVT